MVQVKKAVIAAAGRGTRFLPTTKAYPKELIPILGKPNLQYLVEEIIGAGVNQIAIVYRQGNSQIKRYFTSDQELEKYLKKIGKKNYLHSLRSIRQKIKTLNFIPQTKEMIYGTASPLIAARSFLANDSFVYLFGDDLVLEDKPGNYTSHLISIYQKHQPAIVLGAQKVPWPEINRYASIRYAKDNKYPYQAKEILEKLPAKQAPSNVASFGRFVVSPKIFPLLREQVPSLNKELLFTDAVNVLAKTDVALAIPIKNGQWLTTGDPLRWLKANIEFGLRNKEIKADLQQFLRSFKKS